MDSSALTVDSLTRNFSEKEKEKSMSTENLWDRLPSELQVKVVGSLSAENVRRLALASNHFYSLFSEPSFAIVHDRFLHPRHNFLVTSLLRRRCEYNRSFLIGEHYILEEKDVMSTSMQRSRWQKRLCDVPKSEVRDLLVSGDGFLCFRGCPPTSTFFVVNPLFPKEHHTLAVPRLLGDRSLHFQGIAFDRKHGTCKLVLFSIELWTFVYNFKEENWKIVMEGPNWKGYDPVDLDSKCFATIVNERFLCWQLNVTVDLQTEETMVLVFDVEEDSWEEPIPMGKELFQSVCIAEHAKKLCAIAKTNDILQLWDFDMENRTWRPSKCIPPPPFPFPRRLSYHLKGGREFLWIVGTENEGIKLVLWIYNISRHSWQKPSRFEYIEDEYYEHEQYAYAYHCFESSLFRLK